MRSICHSTILFTLLASVPAGHAEPNPFEAREILVAGDEVDGIGRIGGTDFTVVGVSNDDRVVFTALTSSGNEGVFSADQNGVETLWLPGDPEGYLKRVGRVRTNANRVVFAEGVTTDDIDGLYQITAGATPPLVEFLDVLPEDRKVCALLDFVLSDRGAIGLALRTAPVEGLCRLDGVESLYVFENGSFHNVLATNNQGRATFRLLGLTDEGSLLVGVSDDDGAILSVREDRVFAIVSADDPSPEGTPFSSVRGAAGNSLGHVGFYSGTSTATTVLYRTSAEGVVRVAGVGDVVGDEYEIDSFPEESTVLGDTGAVAIGVWLRHRTDKSVSLGAVLFPPVGGPRLLSRFGTVAGINHRGSVAVYDRDEQHVAVVDESEEEPKRVVGFGDVAPGAGVFATGGFSYEVHALASDGRVVADVSSSLASPALACGDADGFVALTGPTRPARDGSRFRDFRYCTFTETGVLFLGAHEVGAHFEWNLYRADAIGLERLFGPGQVTTDGARILDFTDRVNPTCISNPRGTVVVRARTDRGERLLRYRPEGGIDTILLEEDPDIPIRRVTSIRVRDDDTVVASVQLETEEDAIVTADDVSARLLIVESDPRLPDGPFDSLTLVLVHGERIVIRGMRNGGFAKTFWYSDELGFVPFFADGVEREVQQVTPDGLALVRDSVNLRQFLLAPDGSLTLVAERRVDDLTAAGINDRGNVFFYVYGSFLRTRYQALLLAGPPPSARCPRAPVTETPEPSATPSRTGTPVVMETLTPIETSTPTPTGTPSATDTPTSASPTPTTRLTQTPTQTVSAASASPTVADSRGSSEGCQVTPSGTAPAWVLLLPIFAVIGHHTGRSRDKSRNDQNLRQ